MPPSGSSTRRRRYYVWARTAPVFQAVFSDVVMPGMGGIELAKALRARFPHLPVVLASGYSHVLAREDNHGFELLHKPYSAAQVGRVLGRLIANPHPDVGPREQALTDREDPHADVSDTGRLATLEGYGVLDTSPEAGLDGIVVLARALCAVPFAMVSLVTGKGQWFKARSGFAGCETDLESSVCKHVLGRRDLLVIPDLSRDARTKGNPLVLGEPHIRFYAGAPWSLPMATPWAPSA